MLENLPAVTETSEITALRGLLLYLQSHIHALDKLGKKVDGYATLLGPKIL